jgi:hypothetical protein
MKNLCYSVLLLTFLLAGCSKQTVSPIITPTAATQTTAPINVAQTETLTSIPFTPTALDPTIFGAIGTNEIQAYALESVANAIFKKTMDGFIADGQIQEYQVTSVTIFPGSTGLLSEIIFNVRTADPTWIVEGGMPANDDWLNGKCYRFDFFTTETEYQLKNRRLCG